uniref:F-box/LRR-repeat protein 12 isoform X2 n=1 Tax=Geotrypetes seraphini TaxID=260995 RepID=A0A6P8NWV6_GEOSA|nr:F-box/LRR-repeat protein 12 isoform X2 [Geotrypetes seraphini]
MHRCHIRAFPFSVLSSYCRVCKHWKKLVLDKTLWKDVNLMPYKINSKVLWHLVRHYLGSSLRSLQLKGLLHSVKKQDLLTQNVLQALAKRCPGLQRLCLHKADLRSLSYESLPSSLKVLELSHCEIPFAWFQTTTPCTVPLPQLEHLALSKVPAFSNQDLEMVSLCNPLKTLILSGTYRVTTKGMLLAVGHLKQVKRLTLHGCDISNTGLYAIAKNLKALQHLGLAGFHRLDEGLPCLTVLKTLERLDLWQCDQLSADTIVSVCAELPALKSLNLNGKTSEEQHPVEGEETDGLNYNPGNFNEGVYAVSEKAEALKSEFGTDFDELHLKVQNISSRADTSESDLSSLTSEVQKTSSRVEAMGSDLSSLKLQVSVLSSQFLKMKKLLEVENPCDFLWKSFEGYCYFFYKEELNWMDAKEMCELKNATLAVITSAREQNFLSSRIENEQYWIGLSDANKEGEWEWIDGTDYKSSFKFWKKGEPNDSERNEDCAHLLRKGEWNDLLCTSLSYAICKKAALTP